MSSVTLAVSSGCHVASAAAFKPTLFGNATRRRRFKTLGEACGGRKKKKIRGFCCAGKKTKKKKPLADRSQHWRLCHLWERERCSKPRLLGNGGAGWVGGEMGDLQQLFTHNFVIGPAVPGTQHAWRSRLHLRRGSLKRRTRSR